MTMPVDHELLRQLIERLTEVRAVVAAEINQLDENPPESEEEFRARKTHLTKAWRDLSVMRVRLLHG